MNPLLSTKKWAIVSWQYDSIQDGDYGRCLDIVEGSYEEACAEARSYIPKYSPVSVCGIIEL